MSDERHPVRKWEQDFNLGVSNVKVLPLPSSLQHYAAQNDVKACCELYGDMQVEGVSTYPP